MTKEFHLVTKSNEMVIVFVINYETVPYLSWMDRGWQIMVASHVFVNWS